MTIPARSDFPLEYPYSISRCIDPWSIHHFPDPDEAREEVMSHWMSTGEFVLPDEWVSMPIGQGLRLTSIKRGSLLFWEQWYRCGMQILQTLLTEAPGDNRVQEIFEMIRTQTSYTFAWIEKKPEDLTTNAEMVFSGLLSTVIKEVSDEMLAMFRENAHEYGHKLCLIADAEAERRELQRHLMK